MPFQRSTPEELATCASVVTETERAAAALVAAGKKVHFIWDVDHVLVSGRSDDAFKLLGFDVNSYFTFEERLIAERLEDGPWARIARMKFGDLQMSQDIVTARSSFLAMRVMFWLIETRVDTRWQLFIGHQPKAESYRIILQSFQKDPDMHVFMIDDAEKHVQAFVKVAAELGMSDRCHGIVSPQVREYDEPEMQRLVDGVMQLSGDKPVFIEVQKPELRADCQFPGRYFKATPDPRKTLHHMFVGTSMEMHEEAIVEQNRDWLEKWADEVMPGQPKTTKNLYMLFELLREPR